MNTLLKKRLENWFRLTSLPIVVAILILSNTAVYADSHCNGSLSRVGQRVAAALTDEYEIPLSYCNDIIDLYDQNDGRFSESIRREIENTQSSFALSSPTYSKSFVTQFLAPALAERNARAVSEGGEKPLFKFITVLYPTRLYQDLISQIDGPLAINIAVYQLLPENNANDMRLLVRDKQVTYSGSPELGRESTNNLSIALSGEIGLLADTQFDMTTSAASAITCSWRTADTNCQSTPQIPALAPVANESAMPVFSLTRGYFASRGGFDLQADIALTTALDQAQSTIFLSQVSYLAGNSLSDYLFESIASAVVRGVEVESVIGASDIEENSPAQQLELLGRFIEEEAVRWELDDSEKLRAHCRLYFTVRHDGDNNPEPNNAKFFMVDEGTFYVGSQDLAPTSFWSSGTTASGEYEHGYLIDSIAAANQIQEEYWIPLWRNARNNRLYSSYIPEDYDCAPTAARAELIPTEIISGQTLVTAGDQVQFNSGVKNAGAGRSNNFRVIWRIDGIEVSSAIHADVPPGAEVTDGESDFTWTATSGIHTISFSVDTDDRVNEIDETNNTRELNIAVQEASIDLAVSPIQAPDRTHMPGDQIRLRSSVMNNGTTESNGATVVWRIGGVTQAEANFASIPGGATIRNAKTEYVWTAPAQVGSYDITFSIENTVPDLDFDRSNNSFTRLITVGSGRAALRPTDIEFSPQVAVSGEQITFNAGVKNLQNFRSPPFHVRWLVDGTDIGAGGPHPGVGPGETIYGGPNTFIWTAQPGEHTISFEVDSENEVDELGEDDNVAEVVVTIAE
ncbi:CARDB domain-containing protein [Teredinibacter turnerae]|uniref:CARDB domain-containing protein n=1 Tax=Teredinibacter turnerae TaxID=2426 RepID=UPI00040CE9B3|nr:CARDB domain-containing protein [Teredinibacter turnerae]